MREVPKSLIRRDIKAPIKKNDPNYTPVTAIKFSKDILEGKTQIIFTLPKSK